MACTILLNGKNTPLGMHLSRLFLESGSKVAGLLEGGSPASLPGEEVEENLILIPWNRTSSLSVHNVIVESVNRMESIEELVFLFQPAIDNKPIHELGLSQIESYIDTYVKGSIYLLREVLGYFQKKQRGALYVVLHIAGLEVLPPIDAVGMGAIESFTNSLFTLYQNENVNINGFTSDSSDSREYAGFVFNTIQQKARTSHGKWYRFSDRSLWKRMRS